MTHDVRTRCSSCGTWYWASDGHACSTSPASVLAMAFPAHDRMATDYADARADRVIEAYRARIAEENTYWAGLYGLVLTGTDNYLPRRAA